MQRALELLPEPHSQEGALEHGGGRAAAGADQEQQRGEEVVGDRLLLRGEDLERPQEQVHSPDREAEEDKQVQAGKITHRGLHPEMQGHPQQQPEGKQGPLHQPNLQRRAAHPAASHPPPRS